MGAPIYIYLNQMLREKNLIYVCLRVYKNSVGIIKFPPGLFFDPPQNHPGRTVVRKYI